MKPPLLKHEHNGTRLNWLALVNHYDNMHEEIYQMLSGQAVESLYLSTALESLLPRSPLVISLDDEYDELITQLPSQYTLYFAAPSDLPFDVCTEQLRNRMHLYLSGGRKGLFHYYLPSVAGDFFSLSDHSDTVGWLGCFTMVCFYYQPPNGSPGWMSVAGEIAPPDSDVRSLSLSQEKALSAKYTQQQISEECQHV